MIFSIRLFLVTFLVLLQFIAPLVHAHTSEETLSQGVHVPGLEHYAQSSNTNSFHENLLCKVSAFCNHIDGIVVGVDTGFNRDAVLPIQALQKIIADLHDDNYLPVHSIIFKFVVFILIATLAISTIPLVNQLASFAHSPRAPPQA